jgi:hypothetical protein
MNINFTCRKMDNNQALICSPTYIENFAPVDSAQLTKLGWYQVAGTVSGTGGPGDSNVFTTDQNWSYTGRIPSNYKKIDAFQLLVLNPDGKFNQFVSMEPAGNGVKIVLGMNTNLAGKNATFWFKNILKDNMGGNSEAEFKAVGAK